MAQEVGATILQAAQQINQQLASQNQLALQASRFAQQVQAAEESVRLREQNLELQQKKVDLDAELAVKDQALRAAAGARSERAVSVQESQLQLKIDAIAADAGAAAKLAARKTESEIALNLSRAAGLGANQSPRSQLTQNQLVDRQIDFAESFVWSTDENKVLAGASKETIEQFKGFSEIALRNELRAKRSKLAGRERASQFLDPNTADPQGVAFFKQSETVQGEIDEIELYIDTLNRAASNAVFLDKSPHSQAIMDSVAQRMGDKFAAIPAQLEDAASAALRGELPTQLEAYRDLVPMHMRSGGSFDAFTNAFVGDFTNPAEVELAAAAIREQIPVPKTLAEYDLIGPQINAFVNTLENPPSTSELQRIHNAIVKQFGLLPQNEPAR